MESIETLIPDNEGNHLVVVLSFYEENQKIGTFQIPCEYVGVEIADISIEKLYIDHSIGIRAFYKMCQWLIEQFEQFPNSVFSFICSTDPLATNHDRISPEYYRWSIFEALYLRYADKMNKLGIESKDIIVGPEGYQTFARVFYRSSQAPIVHLVIAHLSSKYR